MPQRNRIRTITGGPQGPDAQIVIIMPTIGEMRGQQAKTKGLDKASDEMEQIAREYIAAHVRQWNWVDDDGEPLPKPFNNPDVFGDLMPEEVSFIGDCLAGKAPEVLDETKK